MAAFLNVEQNFSVHMSFSYNVKNVILQVYEISVIEWVDKWMVSYIFSNIAKDW